ncbi:histidine kinase, partial [Streptomyces sp. T-3]|nr:histidine kinase [Streptomyces sp. T-3]
MNIPSSVRRLSSAVTAPFRPQRLRPQAGFLATGVLLHGAALLLWVWFVLALFSVPAAALVPLVLALGSVVPRTWLQRHRFRAYADTDIPPVTAVAGRHDPVRAWRRVRSGAYWRQFAYHQLAGLLLGVAEAVALLLWVGGAAALLNYVWSWPLSMDWSFTRWLWEWGWLLMFGGLGLLFAAPRLTDALIRAEVPLALRLLGPSRAEELEQRVDDLTERRAETLAAADAERRRIERDLHDGAQQRLVSLAVNLGLARATLPDLPPEARRVIDEAHSEAKAAIEELNQLVRGLHPAV